MSGDICPDDRFELLGKARGILMEKTNIEMRGDEMAVLDSILFRCWQMGWLDQLRECTVLATVTDGLTGDDPKRYFELSCGHSLFLSGLEDVPKFCPKCGANVVSKARRAMTNYEKLFGTPERTARTLARMCFVNDGSCAGCPMFKYDIAHCKNDSSNLGSIVEWLESEVCDDQRDR